MADAPIIDKSGFWVDRIPCWIIRGCPPESRSLCSAYLDQSMPCWEHDDTLSKKYLDIDTCFACEVLQRYGSAEKVSHTTSEESHGAFADRR